MAINLDNRVIHRFIKDIASYELGGEFYSQIIPLDTQAYASYPDEEDNNLFYVIGDGEHTYTELRDGKGNGPVYREYPVLTKENLEEFSGDISKEVRDRKQADSILQEQIDDIRRFDESIDQALIDEIHNREVAIEDLSNEISTKLDKISTPSKVYGTDSDGNQVVYDVNSFGKVDDVKVGNDSVVVNKIATLGTMAGKNASDYSTKAVADTLYADKIETEQALAGKQNNLTQPQLDAVNSGITSSFVSQITTNQTNIGSIEEKIPAQASAQNQLTDRNFVNSSIATNTANFIGTFDSLAELEAYSGPVTNNDYAFVINTDESGNVVYDRYKYTVATNPASWEYEFSLNNSSFTSNQWAAINSGATEENIAQITTNTNAIDTINNSAPMNSGITSTKVSNYDAHIGDSTIHVTASDKQTWNAKQNVLTAGSNIQINGDVISATDTTYSAGEGISIENGVISNTQTSAEWGNITGTLSDQEDLQSALDGKVTQYSQMPVASNENDNQIVQYIGQTTSGYTNGYFYKNNSQTVTENWVNFEPSSEEYEIEVNVTIEDFELLLTQVCEGRPFTAHDVTHGNIGYYSADRLSFSGDTDDGQFFYMTMTLAEFEEAGITFNPAIGPRQGVKFTCAINKQTTTYSWQQINVQPSSGSSEVLWGNINGNLSDQEDLQSALNNKQDVINDLDDIRSGASAGTTALQPNDNISELINDVGYITGISSSDVTTALGYTPYDSSNPDGYTTNVGTVTSVNNSSPDSNGNVTLSIPAAQVNSDWDAVSGVAEILNKPTLGTMAAENASDYTPTANLATVATTGDYSDLIGTPSIPIVNDATLTISQNGVVKGTFSANASTNTSIDLDSVSTVATVYDYSEES